MLVIPSVAPYSSKTSLMLNFSVNCFHICGRSPFPRIARTECLTGSTSLWAIKMYLHTSPIYCATYRVILKIT